MPTIRNGGLNCLVNLIAIHNDGTHFGKAFQLLHPLAYNFFFLEFLLFAETVVVLAVFVVSFGHVMCKTIRKIICQRGSVYK